MKRWLESLQQTKLVKSIIYFITGIFSYPGLAIINKLKISGTENLNDLPCALRIISLFLLIAQRLCGIGLGRSDCLNA